jgi:hypothetical protein
MNFDEKLGRIIAGMGGLPWPSPSFLEERFGRSLPIIQSIAGKELVLPVKLALH